VDRFSRRRDDDYDDNHNEHDEPHLDHDHNHHDLALAGEPRREISPFRATKG
jgi:hypothetical protein